MDFFRDVSCETTISLKQKFVVDRSWVGDFYRMFWGSLSRQNGFDEIVIADCSCERLNCISYIEKTC